MKVKVKQSIFGNCSSGEHPMRLHADEGDSLKVIFQNPTHFICESKYYEGLEVVVFPSQVAEVIREKDIYTDEYDIEKYYHVYEDKNKTNLDDPFCTAFESEESDELI